MHRSSLEEIVRQNLLLIERFLDDAQKIIVLPPIILLVVPALFHTRSKLVLQSGLSQIRINFHGLLRHSSIIVFRPS